MVLLTLLLAACNTDTNTGEDNNGINRTEAPGGGLVDNTPVPGLIVPTETAALPVVETPVVETPAVMETGTPAAGAANAPVAINNAYRLSTVLDHEVMGLNGEEFGNIENLVVAQNGQILYGALQTGDFLGLGGNTVLVPWSAFKPFMVNVDPLSGNELVAQVTEDQLKNAPNYANGALPDFTAANWDADTLAFWNDQNLSIPMTGDTAVTANPVVLNTNDLGALNVVNTNGEDLGEISDYIVNQANSQIQYAVFQTGGVLGLGERNIAVPWTSLGWTADGNALLAIPQDQLESAPYFDNWDNLDLTNNAFGADWDSYWQAYPAPAAQPATQ